MDQPRDKKERYDSLALLMEKKPVLQSAVSSVHVLSVIKVANTKTQPHNYAQQNTTSDC